MAEIGGFDGAKLVAVLGGRFVTEHDEGKAGVEAQIKISPADPDAKGAQVSEGFPAHRDIALDGLSVAPGLQRQQRSRRGSINGPAEAAQIGDRLMIELENQIAFAQAGQRGRGVGAEGGDEEAGLLGRAERFGKGVDDLGGMPEAGGPGQLVLAADPAALVGDFGLRRAGGAAAEQNEKRARQKLGRDEMPETREGRDG